MTKITAYNILHSIRSKITVLLYSSN